ETIRGLSVLDDWDISEARRGGGVDDRGGEERGGIVSCGRGDSQACRGDCGDEETGQQFGVYRHPADSEYDTVYRDESTGESQRGLFQAETNQDEAGRGERRGIDCYAGRELETV